MGICQNISKDPTLMFLFKKIKKLNDDLTKLEKRVDKIEKIFMKPEPDDGAQGV